VADQRVDEKYTPMRDRHDAQHASANGYVGNWFFQREQRFLLNRIQPGLTLDIACGSGLMLKRAPGLDVIGLDFNADACRQARSNQTAITRGDAFTLPFAEHCFDNVVNCQFLNQQPIGQEQLFITEAARVLKPGGQLHIMWRGATTLIHRSVNQLSRTLNRVKGEPNFPQFVHTPDNLVRVAKSCHLSEVVRTMTLPLGPAEIQPQNPFAAIFGASHYLCLEKTG
tara:strand:+ start:1903 stop:2580 length:678 start_codon:yes stop_codon:yes gene_type:complete